MTIICAVHDGTNAWLGCDQLVTAGKIRVRNNWVKWVNHNGWWLGIAGDTKMQIICMDHADDIFGSEDPALVTQNMQRFLLEEGHTREDTTNSRTVEGDFILSGYGGLWDVGCDFSRFMAAGGDILCAGDGSALARGAYYAAQKLGRCYHERISLALGAAIRYATTCGGEKWIKKVRLYQP